MKHFRGLPILIVAVALAAIVATSAFAAAQKKITFSGSYKGTVTEKVDGSSISATAAATGKGTVIGSGTLAGVVKATTANPPCSPISGPGTVSGPKGKLKLTVTTGSRGCAAGEDDQNNITLSGTAKVTGGTGTFKKAKGSLHFSGHYDRKGGSFNVKLTGPLTY